MSNFVVVGFDVIYNAVISYACTQLLVRVTFRDVVVLLCIDLL